MTKNLSLLHDDAAKIVWNIEKCRSLEKSSFDSVNFAIKNNFPVMEKAASEKLGLYKKCEERFKARYVNILKQINNTEL